VSFLFLYQIDKFVIETRNIFRTCSSCRRELLMLEQYVKSLGKEIQIIVHSDEAIDGTKILKEKLNLKNKLMEIQYLKKLEQNKTIRNSKIEGVSEVVIKQVENRLNIKFPEVYKEYLYLAGEYNGGLIMFPGHSDLTMLADEDVQKDLKQQVSKAYRNGWVSAIFVFLFR